MYQVQSVKYFCVDMSPQGDVVVPAGENTVNAYSYLFIHLFIYLCIVLKYLFI